MMTKKEQRLRRSRQTRQRIAKQNVARLTVFRSNVHIFASVISEDGGRVLASASTVEKVAFDRSGFAYHGRVKALAEAAREAGLQF